MKHHVIMPQAVVLGNGSFPTHGVPLTILEDAPFLVCCDGAVNKLVEHGMTPDVIIGDGDSISPENRERFADRLIIVADQETNDQTKAVKYLLQKGLKRIFIVGATGGREDHTIGNISLLVEYRRMGAVVLMHTDTGMFITMSGEQNFFSIPGQQVSVFSISARNISSKGLKYPLYDFTNWWQGTLNEATGSGFTIKAEGEYIVFMAYPPL